MFRSLLAGLTLLGPTIAQATDADAVREALAATCPAATTRLESNAALDAAAAVMSQGRLLDDALAQVHYRQHASMAATISGKAGSPERLTRTFGTLFGHYCDTMQADGYTEIGLYRTTDKLLLIFARPRREVTADDIPALRAELLTLINAARAQPRQCGAETYAAAGPLRYSEELTKAAIVHAVDMARADRLDHAGSDGSDPRQRIARAGYVGGIVGENLASGFDRIEDLVRGWLDSPAHCSNIMEPRFEQMGAAFAFGNGDNPALYWAQTFAGRGRIAVVPTTLRR